MKERLKSKKVKKLSPLAQAMKEKGQLNLYERRKTARAERKRLAKLMVSLIESKPPRREEYGK